MIYFAQAPIDTSTSNFVSASFVTAPGHHSMECASHCSLNVGECTGDNDNIIKKDVINDDVIISGFLVEDWTCFLIKDVFSQEFQEATGKSYFKMHGIIS